jgi:hypothetical protein
LLNVKQYSSIFKARTIFTIYTNYREMKKDVDQWKNDMSLQTKL